MNKTIEKTIPNKKQIEKKPLIKLPKTFFDAKINTQAIFDSIMSERSSIRQGTHKVKSRSEVRGGGKKPFAQKGTGNARQGSIRSPQWVGGGIVWGPNTNKNYNLKVNKKVKNIAFKSALTLKSKNKAIIVHDFKMNELPNTKNLIKQLNDLNLKKQFKKILIVTNDKILHKSASNVQNIFVSPFNNLKIELIVNVDFIIFSKSSIEKMEVKK